MADKKIEENISEFEGIAVNLSKWKWVREKKNPKKLKRPSVSSWTA